MATATCSAAARRSATTSKALNFFEPIYLITIFLLPVTVLLIFGMRFVAQLQQAKLHHRNDEAYRLLAERSIAAQAETAAALADLKITHHRD
jgi:hypothetical protein